MMRVRRLLEVNQCLLLIFGRRRIKSLSLSFEGGAILNQRPGLPGMKNATIFMFLDREDQALPVPYDGRMELIPVRSSGNRGLAIGAVALHSVSWRPGRPKGIGFNNQDGIAIIDVESYIAHALGRASFVTLFPRP